MLAFCMGCAMSSQMNRRFSYQIQKTNSVVSCQKHFSITEVKQMYACNFSLFSTSIVNIACNWPFSRPILFSRRPLSFHACSSLLSSIMNMNEQKHHRSRFFLDTHGNSFGSDSSIKENLRGQNQYNFFCKACTRYF